MSNFKAYLTTVEGKEMLAIKNADNLMNITTLTHIPTEDIQNIEYRDNLISVELSPKHYWSVRCTAKEANDVMNLLNKIEPKNEFNITYKGDLLIISNGKEIISAPMHSIQFLKYERPFLTISTPSEQLFIRCTYEQAKLLT